MARASSLGRPAQRRNAVAGEHLRLALRLLGKTWRKNTRDPDHVLNWSDWTALGLPRSATTIDADMRHGVPEERLSAYAQCLGISLAAFKSHDTDIRAELGLPGRSHAAAPPLDFGFGPAFRDDYLAYNSKQYLQRLFGLLGGVYRVHYVLPIADFVNRCAFWLYRVGDHRLRGRGMFMRFGLENMFDATMLRWHNNLHTTYLCNESKEFGHFLLNDPLRHNLIMRRIPFWLRGVGMTDSGLSDNAPVAFTFRMERLTAPDGVSSEDVWRAECEGIRRRPSIHPGEPDHDSLRSAIEDLEMLP